MDAILKVIMTSECVSVKYNCRILEQINDSDPANSGFQVILDYNRLSRLIEKDMACDVVRSDNRILSGTINNIKKNNGKIQVAICRPKRSVKRSRS
jgi:hypothetical protein